MSRDADICIYERFHMISFDIPGFRELSLSHLLLDFNGTIAQDGTLINGVREALDRLAPLLTIHVITADTFGEAREELRNVPCALKLLIPGNQAEQKQAYLHELGADITACIGNGRNDCLMLRDAAVGIAVMQKEGAAVVTLQAADMATGSIIDALELFTNPLRLKATLRS